jgi:hypothetical protein
MKLLVHNQDALNPEHQEEIKEKQRIYADSLMKILEELKADGKMIDLDTKACYESMCLRFFRDGQLGVSLV